VAVVGDRREVLPGVEVLELEDLVDVRAPDDLPSNADRGLHRGDHLVAVPRNGAGLAVDDLR